MACGPAAPSVREPVAVTTLFVIETAGDFCSLALARAGAIDTLRSAPGHNHLEHVMPMVEALFARHGIAPAQCDAFAFASGPGSFTGLRVACTIVQGLALGADRPVIAVGNLLALAAGATASGAGGGHRRVLSAVDARMQQAYVAVHEGAGTKWHTLLAPCVVGAGALPALVRQWQPDVCAGDAVWLRGRLDADAAFESASAREIAAGDAAGAAMSRHAPHADIAAGHAPRICDARVEPEVLARLALAQLARGEVLAPHAAVPEYVRNDVARTVAQRRAAMPAGTA